MTQNQPITSFLLLFFIASMAHAKPDHFDIGFKGLIDARLIASDANKSWLNRGLGKIRYDQPDHGSIGGAIADASLLILPQFNQSTSAFIHLKYDNELTNKIGIVESYAQYKSATTSDSTYRLSAKMGVFFPPISLENRGLAWTSPYSITPSAINSWVGEELKVLGAEFRLQRRGENHLLELRGAAFRNNDTAGTLLAWRGWAIHDRKSNLVDKLPLARLSSISTAGAFPEQAAYTKPFNEVDNRTGYYAELSWKGFQKASVRALYYDNRANPTTLDDGQYGWDTRFLSLGARFKIDDDTEILLQMLNGKSKMGRRPFSVDIAYRSAYLLASKRLGPHRVSARVDWFDVDDLDQTIGDNNNENGVSGMLGYTYQTTKEQKWMLEFLITDSNRPGRADIGENAETVSRQIQASYRLIF